MTVEPLRLAGVDSEEVELDPSRAEPDPFAEAHANGNEPAPTGLPLLPLDELLARPPVAPEWIWQGRIAAGDVALWIGDPGVGKSMVALSLAIGVATGGAQLLDEPCAPGASVVIDLENTIDEVFARLRALGAVAETCALAYVHRPPGFNLAEPTWRERLRATIAQQRPQLLVIDSMRRAAPGLDENDSTAVAAFMAPVRDLAAEFGCAIVLVHHPRKPLGGERVEALHAARGSGDLVASVDSLFYFRRLGEGQLVRIEQAKARRGHPHEPGCYVIEEDDAGGPALRPVTEGQAVAESEYAARVLAYLAEHPWATTTELERDVPGRATKLREARKSLAEAGRIYSAPSRDLGRSGTATCWNLADASADEGSSPVPLPGTDADDGGHQDGAPSHRPTPVGGTGLGTDGADPRELEWE